MSLEDTIASINTGQNGIIGAKPDTSHTTGNPSSGGPHGAGSLTQVARQSGQAIMAQTFTGKMFSMRNNSLKNG